MLPLSSLKKMFPPEMDLGHIIFLENKITFEKKIAESRYADYFHDRFGGVFGHCTKKGNRIIAENIANSIIKIFR